MMAAPYLAIALLVVGGCADAQPQFTETMVLGGKEVSAEVLNQGQRKFALYCASCHGADGSGQGAAARSLQTKPRDFRQADFKYKSTEGDALPTDEDLAQTILMGRIETGMPAWNGLTAEDRDAVIHYIKTFSPRWQQAKPEAEAPQP